MPPSYTIVHLNDQHRWSRERIADWLDTLDHDLFIQPKGTTTDGNNRDSEKARELEKAALAIYAGYGLTDSGIKIQFTSLT